MSKSERNSSYLGQYWKHKKCRPHFGNGRTRGNFVIIISRNLLLKLGSQLNAANYIKHQDDIQVVLHTVMFRGTLCTNLRRTQVDHLESNIKYLQSGYNPVSWQRSWHDAASYIYGIPSKYIKYTGYLVNIYNIWDT